MGGCLARDSAAVNHKPLMTKDKSIHENLCRQRIGFDIEKYYTIQGTVGVGSIGTVVKAEHNATKELFAVKTINVSRMTKDLVDELINEVTILMSLDHPNIVRPIELFRKKRELYLVLPLCSGGDLYTRSPYSESDAARYVGQMIDAVAYMHSNGVIHRDLKFENILFASKAMEAEVLVIDFGLAKANYAAKAKLDEFCGTLYSMAPEVLRGSYGDKCDVWSLGVLTYMLLAGAMPFTRFSDEKGFLRDLERERYDLKRLQNRSSNARKFVKALLVAKEEKRPTSQEIKSLAWIKNVNRSSSGPLSLADMDKSDRQCSAGESQAVDGGLTEANFDMAEVGKSLEEYSNSAKLRKLALMVVAHRSDSDSIKGLRAAFRAVDTANEGFITAKELEKLLKNCGYEATVIDDIYKAVDINKTGEISYTEFCAACLEGTSLVQEDDLAKAFDRLDSDDSGFITKENLRGILGKQFTPALAREMIDDGDYKGNGKVDFDEFMCLMRDKRRERKREIDDTTLPTPKSNRNGFH